MYVEKNKYKNNPMNILYQYKKHKLNKCFIGKTN